MQRSGWGRAAPALAALVYPGVVWAGPAVTPIFLALALVLPVVAVAVFHQTPAAYPRTRAIALLAVGGPALYSWFGGLLDFQRVVPLTGLGVWWPLWTLGALVAARERPGAVDVPARSARLAVAHGVSAVVVALFAAAHVGNHLSGLWGGERHIAVMAALRVVYRHPLGETVLLTSVAFQLLSGVRLLRRHVRRNGTWIDALQASSGAYLACFFASHLTAALRARWLRGVDTNWLWLTADSMLTDPWSARLAPYYYLAIVAIGTHAAAGLRYVLMARSGAGSGARHAHADRVFVTTAAAAAGVSALVMAALLRG